MAHRGISSIWFECYLASCFTAVTPFLVPRHFLPNQLLHSMYVRRKDENNEIRMARKLGILRQGNAMI